MIAIRGSAVLEQFFPSKNLDEALKVNKGIGPGFDFLRIALSILIFYGHVRLAVLGAGDNPIINLAGTDIQTSPILSPTAGWTVEEVLDGVRSRLYVLYVPMFFALSGFLVAGSALRLNSVGTFLGFRALRIFPALAVEVTISALVLGLFFTTYSFGDYFFSKDFLQYLGNMLGLVHYHLPGVFEDNPFPRIVNINLWTLPSEFYCYLIMALVMFLGLLANRVFLLVLFSLIYVTFSIASFMGYGLTPGVYPVHIIVFHFGVGTLMYLWRDKIVLSPYLFIACSVIVLLLLRDPSYAALLSVPLTYITVYIGFMAFLNMPFMKGRDYSYGIYLYGFPITQAFVAVMPDISRTMLLLYALSVTVAVSVISWHYIEKPCLALRKGRSPKPV